MKYVISTVIKKTEVMDALLRGEVVHYTHFYTLEKSGYHDIYLNHIDMSEMTVCEVKETLDNYNDVSDKFFLVSVAETMEDKL